MKKIYLIAALGLEFIAGIAEARNLQVNNHRNHSIYAAYGYFISWFDETGYYRAEWKFEGWYKVPSHSHVVWDTGNNRYAYLRVESGQDQLTRSGWGVCLHQEENFSTLYEYDGLASAREWKFYSIGVGNPAKYTRDCGNLDTTYRGFERIDFQRNTGFEYNVRP